MIPRSVKILILVHIVITLTGLISHLDHHPPGQSLFFWWPALVGGLSLLVIPVLYAMPATVAWGFLFNVMAVAIGTIGMSYFTLLTFEEPYNIYRIATESTLPKIILLWVKLLIAWFILAGMKPLKKSGPGIGCLE